MQTLPVLYHIVVVVLAASPLWWYRLQNVLDIAIQSFPSCNPLIRSFTWACRSRQCVERASPNSVVGGALLIPLLLLCSSSACCLGPCLSISTWVPFSYFRTSWWVCVSMTTSSVTVDGSSSPWRHSLYRLMGLCFLGGIHFLEKLCLDGSSNIGIGGSRPL